MATAGPSASAVVTPGKALNAIVRSAPVSRITLQQLRQVTWYQIRKERMIPRIIQYVLWWWVWCRSEVKELRGTD